MAPETANTSNAWFDWTETSTVYAHFPLRLALAAVFGFHSIDKFVNGVPAFADAMGLPLFAGWLVAFGEFAIAIGAVYGAFHKFPNADTVTRAAGALTMIIMLGAIGMVHFANGWHFMRNGMEFQFVLVMIGLFFVLRGNRI